MHVMRTGCAAGGDTWASAPRPGRELSLSQRLRDLKHGPCASRSLRTRVGVEAFGIGVERIRTRRWRCRGCDYAPRACMGSGRNAVTVARPQRARRMALRERYETPA